METTIGVKRAFDNATNLRRDTFADLKPLVTKVINSYAVSGAGALAVADANGIKRKLQGTRAAKKQDVVATEPLKDATAPVAKRISASQLSFDNQVDQLSKLIQLLNADTNYAPNEKELQTTALAARLDAMKASTAEQMRLEAKWNDTMAQRDAVLYDAASGLVQTALEVKKYVKSVFGTQSPQFKQVNSISFRKYVK